MAQGTEIPAVTAKQNVHDAHDATGAGCAVDADAIITGFDALYESMTKCQKGVMWKASVASYRLNAIERTLRLMNDLNTGHYRSKPPMHFQVTFPKVRDIASVAFRDRVYQRSLNDNVAYPLMTESFIYDNYACQKGKGTDFARNRLKEFMHRYYRRYGSDGYVYQFDIKGYYPNMSHRVCEEVFKRKLPPRVYGMVEKILHDQYDGESGYNAGSQLIQIAGISVLNDFDHYVKEQLHAKFYGRYMDDFFIIHHDKRYLEVCAERIKAYLEKMEFKLHEEKCRCHRLTDGIDYLGFTFRLTSSGKVLMLIKSNNIRAQRRKLPRLVKQSKNGKMPKEKVDESYQAWRANAAKGNTYKCIQRMDRLYKSLWR